MSDNTPHSDIPTTPTAISNEETPSKSGFIATLSETIKDKIQASIDFATGRNRESVLSKADLKELLRIMEESDADIRAYQEAELAEYEAEVQAMVQKTAEKLVRLHLDANNVNVPEIDDALIARLSKDTTERIMRFRTEDSDGWVEFMAVMKQENPPITSLPEGLVSSVGGAEKTQIQAPVVYAEACEGVTHREKPAEQPKAKPKRPKM